jgi:pyridoxine 4-dehydrogenase
MPTPNAADAGQFTIGGDLTVNRLGFGAMRITGRGIWGPPKDKAEALRVLRRLPELNVNFIDTADSYGPYVSEELIREALHPYPAGMVIATKAGFQRPGPDNWRMDGRPATLRAGIEGSLKRLGLERLDLWQLHRIDPKVPSGEQFEAIRGYQQEGLIRHVGLSEVSVEEIEEAGRYFKVTTVQNHYHPRMRHSEDVLRYCADNGIGFIPWAPLGSGRLTGPGVSILDTMAQVKIGTRSQLAIAWSLRKRPVVLAIPGTGSLAHLEENVGAASIRLSERDFSSLEDIY